MEELVINEEYMVGKINAMTGPGTLDPSILEDVRRITEAGGSVRIDPEMRREHTRKIVNLKLAEMATAGIEDAEEAIVPFPSRPAAAIFPTPMPLTPTPPMPPSP